MDPPINEVVHDFNRLVRQYFASIEAQSIDRRAWLEQIQLAVAELYAAALRLPLPKPPSKDDAPSMPADDVRSLSSTIHGKLGRDAVIYWHFYDPLKPGEEPVAGSLQDDLSDIFVDLRSGATLLDGGGTPEDVAWEWRFSFDIHWGQHALGALQALKALLE